MSTKSKFKGFVVCTKAQFDALTEKDTDKAYLITDDDSSVTVVQTTGTSTTAVMSQDATTKAIDTAKTACNSYTDSKIAEAITTALNTAV